MISRNLSVAQTHERDNEKHDLALTHLVSRLGIRSLNVARGLHTRLGKDIHDLASALRSIGVGSWKMEQPS